METYVYMYVYETVMNFTLARFSLGWFFLGVFFFFFFFNTLTANYNLPPAVNSNITYPAAIFKCIAL